MTAATGGKRRCGCHRRRRRGCAATTVGATTDRSPSMVVAAPAVATPASGNASMPTPASLSPTSPRSQQQVPPSSPEVITQLAKRTRRRCNEVELHIAGAGGGGQAPPLSSLPSFLLSSPPRSHMSSTTSLPLIPPALTGLPAPPVFPASPPPGAALSAGAAPFASAYRCQLLSACCIHHPSCTTHVHPFSVSLL
jgi:hypothetical protein